MTVEPDGTAGSSALLVVKLGGRTQADAALPPVLARLWTTSGGRMVIVHGGGDQISTLQRMRGEEPVFVGGRRVTTEGVLEIVRMVLSGLANKQLVSALTSAGAPAVGISGEDAAMLRATPIDTATFGFAGTPTAVDRRLVDALLSSGFLPVISPVATAGADGDGGALNVNGDDAAAAIAAALGASELFLLADVAGGGMAAKLDACAIALAGGVARVRIGDLAALVSPASGTSIVT